MAVAARKRESRRVPYERLRERLAESQLPWDDAAERNAIGAVLLAPNGWAQKLSRRAYSGHFYDRGHGWLWEQIGTALVTNKRRLDSESDIGEWLQQTKLCSRFRAQFFGSCGREISLCLRDCFWWHGHWYIDRVISASKVRANVIAKAKLLGEALDAAEQWNVKQ